MMLLIFAVLMLAFVGVRFAPRWLAVAAALLCLALSAGLFLFEIDSPEDGFRMPWLQTRAHGLPFDPAPGEPL